MIKSFLFLILFYLNSSNGYEILCIFPRPSYSHQSVFRAITEKLLENHHQITLMSTHPSENEKNHENVTLADVSSSSKFFEASIKELMTGKAKSWKDAFYRVVDAEASLIDHQLSSPEMQKILKDKIRKFDLLLIETAGFSPFHALADHFKIPVVGITSADAFFAGHAIMGNVINPVAHPDRILPFAVSKTFLQRLGSCLFVLLIKFMIIPRAEANYQPIMEKHFPNIRKSYFELVSNVDLQLVNTNPAMGFLRPILPNTIQLGFLHIKPPKPLPDDLQNILDNSKHGVIYMSYGTIVISELFEQNFASFSEAFENLPYDVLWKFEAEKLKNIPKNVHIKSFFPQSDLLAHPNVKLFITHGGQHSIEESIIRNVPMIVCPFQGDQNANAERVVERKIAKSLNIREKLSPNEIKSAINDVINNESFKINIEKLAQLVEDAPMKPVDKAVWHIENVIRNKGASHLRYQQKEISFYQYHYYDILLSALGLLTVALLLIIFGLKMLVKCVKKLDDSAS